jgi:NADH-quinone oxidoreductase subunit E
VPNFNLDAPINKTKPSPREENKGKVATVVEKATDAVKAAAAKVGEHRHAGKDAGETKDPQVRTAETRNPTAATPDKTGDAQATTPVATNAAEAEGVAQNPTAGDGKPAGDSVRNEEQK